MSFKEYLNEKLMTFGRKTYPRFGQVVILGGGAGSGKGFQLNSLLGVEGKVFDVDSLKQLAVRAPMFAKRVKDETGHDIQHFDLRDSNSVFKLHDILASVYHIPRKNQEAVFGAILTAPPERKPNLIFDVTLKDMKKLAEISMNVLELGYEKENIHLVWVINDVNTAKVQNMTRERVVPEEILLDTHEGAALTFKKLLDMGENLHKYMDGDIYFSFNNKGLDTAISQSAIAPEHKGKFSVSKKVIQGAPRGSWVSKADYVKVKDQGKPQKPSAQLSKEVLDKIREYTPSINTW
jgi:hypothetical protein